MRLDTFWTLISEAEKALKLNERYSDADWHVAENTKEHHTDEYIRTDQSLVLRRGQSFKVSFYQFLRLNLYSSK